MTEDADSALHAAVVASVPDAVVTTDVHARIRLVNAAAEALFGVRGEDVRGRDVVETFVAPEHRALAHEWAARLAAGERLEPDLRAQMRRADGECFTAELSLSSVFGADGTVIGMVGMARDITARLGAEADAAMLRAVVDAAEEAIIGIDGDIRFFSPAAERLYGYRAEEVIGRSGDLLAADHRRHHLEAMRTALRAGESVRGETLARRKDGTVVEVQMSARPILTAGGRTRGAALTVLDMTQRRQAERMLERFVENAPNAIALKDLEGRFLVYNARGAAAAGLAVEELLGRTASDVFGPEIGAQQAEEDRRVIEAGVPMTFEQRYEFKGRAYTYVTTKFPLRGIDGRVEAVGLIGADVSDLRRAEADSAQLAALVDAAPDAIVARDADGRIMTWNPGAEALFGLPAAEAIGRSYEQLLVPEDERESFQHALAEAMAGRTVVARSERQRADGTRVPVQIATAPLTSLDGSWHGTLAMIRDISELVEAELELRERAALLERSNADLERFAYVASHDLQEPLNAIKLSARAVLAAAGERLDADERELLSSVDESAGGLSRQVRALMELARVALSDGSRDRVPLESAVLDARGALRAAATAAGAEVKVGELPAVEVPRTELVLVLQNVIANAIKYRRPDEPPRVKVTGQLDDGCVELRVRDNGVGLSGEDLERIFGLFERAQSGVPGTGLGLAVARRLLERHGGSIAASSTGRGCGAEFIIRLPISAA